MHRASIVWLLAFAGCSGERHAPPKDWQRSIEVEKVSAACLPLIGTAGHLQPYDGGVFTRSDEVPLSSVPAVIRSLGATVVEVSAVDVDIQLGRYTIPPEHDHWGLVCTRGEVSSRFQSRNHASGTFLIPLGPHLYYYDGIM
jgi:hypothetical protein